ncbi:response regulator transcription factor [Paraclostridium sordellii]|uniref:Stage 0 sporulation protein A homolog n=2 Tax=Paraclostridium sordellii TaxID=1505 RepID=A0A0C7G5A9_PARSO|nr:response regulator transcription factor [Paeniclostridium sordellii]QYE96429.1 response regulator transcription factor [Paeniclostridium sordellii]CEN78458.1 DNA-binding response regulator [[Clostridium] sordellii] [Paeniclostridium sordellii]CEO08608.1 DNA-binding response regulator [[Clostridium] sordellii] [Paeniclostridium sordellii]CEP87281.1 DNA-binding response regulator [[Clostridium] sordellii] [Paeniclostridium sordellii]CEP95623.1 DNA-binding response regulator [[Clostridium] sor
MYKENILVVEDDVDINNLITKTLEKHDYKVTQAFSGSEALLQLSISEFKLILLDLMLPGMSGEEIINKTRDEKEIPIIVISAKTSLQDKVNVLNIGADDYIIKPFELEEVIARVNSLLRRYKKYEINTPSNEIYKFKNIILEEETRKVKVKEKEIHLTGYEFDILSILIKHPDRVYSRESLYEQVWKNGYYGEDNSVNVHISNIRKKIKSVSENEDYIKTVWGIGFKLNNN